MRKYGTYPFHTLGGVYVSFSCGFFFFFLHTSVSLCAFTHTGTGRMETQRSKAELGQWSHGGDQALAEVVLCAVGLSYYPLWR